MKLFTAVAAAAVLVAGSTVASAAPITMITCGQFSAGPASSCNGISGDANDSAADINTLFSGNAWTLGDKDDQPGETDDDFYVTDKDNAPSYAFRPGTSTGGTFVLSNSLLSLGNQFVLVLKGGNQDFKWAAFLLDVNALVNNSGLWSSRQGLSHASLYYRTGNVTNGGGNGGDPGNGGGNGGSNGGGNGGDPGNGGGNGGNVPEPMTLSLLGLGLAGAGFIRRRK